jgi:hypothetical protein
MEQSVVLVRITRGHRTKKGTRAPSRPFADCASRAEKFYEWEASRCAGMGAPNTQTAYPPLPTSPAAAHDGVVGRLKSEVVSNASPASRCLNPAMSVTVTPG